jgi:hypothetical protein
MPGEPPAGCGGRWRRHVSPLSRCATPACTSGSARGARGIVRDTYTEAAEDLVIVPRPSSTGERRAEISGRAKTDSLLRDQEAVYLQVVAGAGFEPTTFGL